MLNRVLFVLTFFFTKMDHVKLDSFIKKKVFSKYIKREKKLLRSIVVYYLVFFFFVTYSMDSD